MVKAPLVNDMNHRKLSAVYRWLEQRSYDTEELINNIDDVIIKTIISAHPILKHNYRTCFPHHDLCSACFEILGFDILLDYKLKPYVLEVFERAIMRQEGTSSAAVLQAKN